MAFSGTVSVFAMRDNDYFGLPFAGTGAGLQLAIDYLLGGSGKVWIGPGTLTTSSCIWLHSGVRLQGAGMGVTIIKRTTMANGDGNNTGAVICSCPYGSNGTISDSTHTLTDITVSDLTVDGNYSGFGAVTDTALVPSGIRIDYCDGVRILNCKAQNTLGDGFRIRNCRNVIARTLHGSSVGQSATVQARNGVNLIGDWGASGAWGFNYTVSDVLLENVGDEAIQCCGIKHVSIANVDVDGCDFVFECTTSPTVAATFGHWSISNVNARNVLDYFITWNSANADIYENIVFANCTMAGHATLHDGGVVAFPTTSGANFKHFRFENCVFTGINTKDTTSRNWVDCQPGDVTGFEDFSFRGCSFYGLSSSTRTGDVGMMIRGSNRNWAVTDCLFKYVPGVGVRINDHTGVASIVLQDIRVRGCTVDTANGQGFRITAASATSSGTMKNIFFEQCTARDTNIQTSGAGFDCNITQSGATIQKVYFRGCRAYKTSGTTMTHGVALAQSAGTLDDITIEGCDFDGVQTAEITKSGTVTKIHFRPRPGRGTDIASAATISIPTDGDVFHVTGTTNITNGITVNAWDNGRRVYLIFDGALTVSDTGTSKLRGAFVTTADDVLPLVCDGTNWYQAAFESVN